MAYVNREARAELARAVAERYQRSSKEEKTRILDEFVRVTGYHRKHAVRVLRDRAAEREPGRRDSAARLRRGGAPSARRALGSVRPDLREAAGAAPSSSDRLPGAARPPST